MFLSVGFNLSVGGLKLLEFFSEFGRISEY
jgi:hypothetical protein